MFELIVGTACVIYIWKDSKQMKTRGMIMIGALVREAAGHRDYENCDWI